MTNESYQLLKNKIKEKYSTMSDFLNVMGFSRQSFFYKRKFDYGFTTKEISLMKKLLGLTDKELIKIFFENEI